MSSSQEENTSLLSSITNKFFASSPSSNSKKHPSIDNGTRINSEIKSANKKLKKSCNTPYNYAKHHTTRSMSKK
ncbi:12440_t:CDS:1, partial [Ambispora gerdemannii]